MTSVSLAAVAAEFRGLLLGHGHTFTFNCSRAMVMNGV